LFEEVDETASSMGLGASTAPNGAFQDGPAPGRTPGVADVIAGSSQAFEKFFANVGATVS
jgi:hypothetical protein